MEPSIHKNLPTRLSQCDLRPAIRECSISMKDYYAGILERDECLRHELTKLQLFSEQYLYSAFHPSKLELVRRTGSYRSDITKDIYGLDGPPEEFIFICTVLKNLAGEMVISDSTTDNDDSSLVSIVENIVGKAGNIGYFAVYNRNAFKQENIPLVVRFKCPEEKLKALVAIVRVELE